MAVTVKAFGLAQRSFSNKEIDWDSDTVKLLLCTSTYTPNQDTHQYRSSVTNEVTGTNYTAGGVALTSRTRSYDTASNTETLDAADTVFSIVTLTARIAVLYVDTGSSATSPLIGWVDFGADWSPAAQNLNIVWPAAGIVTFSTA